MKRTYILLSLLAGLSLLAVIEFHVPVGIGARRLADKLDPEPCGPAYISNNAARLALQREQLFGGWVRGKPLTLDAGHAYAAEDTLRGVETNLRVCLRR